MSYGGQPPSWSSAAMRNADQPQFGGQNDYRQIDNPLAGYQIPATAYINEQPLSYSDFRHVQGNPNTLLPGGTADRGLGQTDGFREDGQPLSYNAFNQHQGNSKTRFSDGTADRGLVQTGGFGDGGGAPGVDDMGRAAVSHPSGGGFYDNNGPLLSLNDLAKRDASQTAQPPVAAAPDVDPQELVGMSLVGSRFRQVYPMAYYKGDDEKLT